MRSVISPRARLIQNVVGWPEHDAEALLSSPAIETLDIYGFAEPRADALPLPVANYLSKPLAAFEPKDNMSINDRNIAALVRYYRSMALE